jgi:hypothetical protein
VASVGRESNLISVRVRARSSACPGPGTVYLGGTLESPKLVFVRSLEADA